jgi:hypothetical protein
MTGILGGLIGSFTTAPIVTSGDFEFIATANGDGSSGVITFSSIPQDYKHLQVRYVAKGTTTNTTFNLRINGDATAVYNRHVLSGNGSTVTAAATTSQAIIDFGQAMATSTTANLTSSGVIDFLDYTSTTKNKTVKALYGLRDATSRIAIQGGVYRGTSAITSMTFTNSTANFGTLTRYSLYGIRG